MIAPKEKLEMGYLYCSEDAVVYRVDLDPHHRQALGGLSRATYFEDAPPVWGKARPNSILCANWSVDWARF